MKILISSFYLFRIILINIMVFIFIIVTLVLFCASMRAFLGKQPIPLFFYSQYKQDYLDNPCIVMRTHTHYGHTHDHKGKCNIRGGFAEGPFVRYNVEPIYTKSSSKKILTLGGSTTDGFYQYVAEGYTWPLFLHKLCQSSNPLCEVINGGAAAFSSTKEVLRLLVDGSISSIDFDYVISLNGINELEGYGGATISEEKLFPFFDTTQITMMNTQKWIIKNQNYFQYFPNILNLIKYASKASELDINLRRALISPKTRINSNIERWSHNIRLMHSISSSMGAEYFVFLQPTLGLEGPQSMSPSGTNDAKLLKKGESHFAYNQNYFINLRKTYKGLRSECAKISYCYDISSTAPPTGNVYYDLRHHNKHGNELIAKRIFEIINN